MTKAKAKKETAIAPGPAEPKEITREIKGQLAFQRVGGGMATFKTVCPDILSNPMIQIPVDVLPVDYSPDRHSVSGDFVYTIVVKKKQG